MPYKNREDALAYHRQYNRETREWAKAHGFCTQCQKEKAEPGKNLCLVCKMARRESDRKRRETNAKAVRNGSMSAAEKREAQKKRVAKRRKSLIEQGLCTQCGKRKTNGYQICDACREKINSRRRRQYSEKKEVPIKLYHENGYCARCGKPVYMDTRLCEFHYNIAVNNLKDANRGEHFRETNRIFFLKNPAKQKGVGNESASEPANSDAKGD